MQKRAATRQRILSEGLDMASRYGLEDVTIGMLAKTMEMSKSGLFGHFHSKENLQLQIIHFAVEEFRQTVLKPALRAERGIPRIRAMVDHWITWGASLKGGCIFVSASNEFRDRPGPVRDALMEYQTSWLQSLSRLASSAIEAGHFRPDVDIEQFAFELYSLLLGIHYFNTMLGSDQTSARQRMALDRLIANYAKTNN